MSIETYNFNLTLEIGSIYQTDPPECSVILNDQVIFKELLAKSTTLNHQTMLTPDVHCLKIIYDNKSKNDSTQAVLIKSIEFNNIQDKKFIWAGKYTPIYPEPWATEQRDQGQSLAPILSNTDYLGWAGTWSLEFTIPIFTWIHKIKNFGTIYD
jgi:hypothetical protein